MADFYPLMIAGAKTDAGVIEVKAPYDNEIIATASAADMDAVDKAIETAYSLYRNRDDWLSPARRIEILENTIKIMKEQIEFLAIEAAREGGKPLMDSRIEVVRAIDSIKICIETIRTGAGSVIPMGVNAASLKRIAFTKQEPIGVVAAVSAFNHPVNLIAHQAGPAIAAGCPVIVKPAEDTPLSCFRFINILYEAGLPEEWCQSFVVNDLSVAEKFVTDERIGFFSFIGSAKVGWMLRSKLAPGTRCALEHGGAAPVIFAEDAEIDEAVPLLSKGGFYHAGQVCVSVQRVFAHESIARELAEKLAKAGSSMKIGDPILEDTEIGPIIRHKETDRIKSWVDEAVFEGAELISGGEKISDSLYSATVLFDPSDESKVSRLEIFGPVICVYPYSDADDAVRRANSLPYSFQASVFTKDLDRAMRLSSRLDAATVMINDHTAFRVDWMPFAGLKQSGMGTGGIPYTMKDMQIEKLIVVKSKEL